MPSPLPNSLAFFSPLATQFPDQGSNPMPLAVGVRSPNHQMARDVPRPILQMGKLKSQEGKALLTLIASKK